MTSLIHGLIINIYLAFRSPSLRRCHYSFLNWISSKTSLFFNQLCLPTCQILVLKHPIYFPKKILMTILTHLLMKIFSYISLPIFGKMCEANYQLQFPQQTLSRMPQYSCHSILHFLVLHLYSQSQPMLLFQLF